MLPDKIKDSDANGALEGDTLAEETPSALQIVEAVLFAAGEPLAVKEIAEYLPSGAKVPALLKKLEARYADSGVRLVCYGDKYALRTSGAVAPYLQKQVVKQKRLSRAGLEVLAIIAYHQPATRAEIEEIRGVQLGQGTLDRLLELEWIEIKGRREVPGRPLEYATSEQFLAQFHLPNLASLPQADELRDTGFLERRFRATSPEESLPHEDEPQEPAPSVPSAEEEAEDAPDGEPDEEDEDSPSVSNRV